MVGRSDGTISCDFCGQSYIVRVQPAFPGMPQMPMGPGAPSDIGPDGGLVDPGMVGPGGMPMDGGGMPGDDEGVPPGLEPDGEDEGPLDEGGDGGDGASPPSDSPGGDSNKDSNGSGPPSKSENKDSGNGKGKKKPPPSKKKGALIRTYYGLGGQVLTEDQFCRHMAIALSGGSPHVLAAVRAGR